MKYHEHYDSDSSSSTEIGDEHYDIAPHRVTFARHGQRQGYEMELGPDRIRSTLNSPATLVRPPRSDTPFPRDNRPIQDFESDLEYRDTQEAFFGIDLNSLVANASQSRDSSPDSNTRAVSRQIESIQRQGTPARQVKRVGYGSDSNGSRHDREFSASLTHSQRRSVQHDLHSPSTRTSLPNPPSYGDLRPYTPTPRPSSSGLRHVDHVRNREFRPQSSVQAYHRRPSRHERYYDPAYRFNSPNPEYSQEPAYHSPRSFPTPTRRRRTKEPKTYDGKKDLMDYLNYFIRLARLNAWDYDTCGLELSTSLVGEAADVPNTLAFDLAEDLQSLVKALIRRFCPRGREAHYSNKLMNRTWDSTKETISDYAGDLHRLARKAYPHGGVYEPLMIDLFKKGLHPDMQMQVTVMNPRNFDEAIGLATSMEPYVQPKGVGSSKKPKNETVASLTDKGNKNQFNNRGSKKSNDRDPDRDMYNKFQMFMRGNGQANTNNPQDAYPDVECFYCKQKGHYKSDCTKLKARQAKDQQHDNKRTSQDRHGDGDSTDKPLN